MANVIEYTIRGVDKFSGAMGSVNSSIGSIAKSISGLAAGVAAAATAVTVYNTKITAGMEASAKAAIRMGESVQSYTALESAAEMANISNEEFASTMQTLNKNSVEASHGIGRAKMAFDLMGISAIQFKKLGMDEKLELLSQKMSEIKNPTEQAALATKLFGDNGAKMIDMLSEGKAGLDKAKESAAKFGTVMSDQAAANAIAFQDSLDNVGLSIKGVNQAISNELSPVLTGLANKFADSLASSRESIVAFVKTAIDYFFTAIEVIKQFGNGVYKIFTDRRAFQNFLDGLGELAKNAGVAMIAIGKLLVMGIWEGLKLAGQMIGTFALWVGESLHKLATGQEVTSFSDLFANVIADGVNKAKENMAPIVDETIAILKIAGEESGAAFADMFGINLDIAHQKALDTIAALSEYGDAASVVVNENATAMAENTISYMEALSIKGEEWLAGMRDNAMAFATDFYAVMDSAIQGISDGIASVIVEGGSFRDMFNNVAKQVLQNLISMLIKLGIQRLVLAGLTKGAIATESMSQMSAETGRTYASTFASISAIPIVGPAMAPGIAMASVATMLSGAVGAAAAGSGVGAAIGAHGGMTNVPSEQTYLLDRGERVLSPNQNSDLKEFMSSGGATGGGVVIENLIIHILENATNADSLLNMSKVELDRLVSGPIIDSLNRLDQRGIRPASQERKRS